MSSSAIYIIATVVAALAAVVALFYARRQAKTVITDDARQEALDLASVRAAALSDLRTRLDTVEGEQRTERTNCDEKIAELKNAIDVVRSEAADAHRLLVAGLRGMLADALKLLEAQPPDVAEAIRYLRDALHGDGDPQKVSRRRNGH